MTFPHYYALLDRLHEHLGPVATSRSGWPTGTRLGLTRPGTLAVGVDPVPGAEVGERAPGRRVEATTSEEFFARFAGRTSSVARRWTWPSSTASTCSRRR